jgi:hypothetical protein
MGDSCAQGGKPGIKETGTPEDVPRTAAITHAAGIKKAPADVMGALLRLELHGFPHPVAELAATVGGYRADPFSATCQKHRVVHWFITENSGNESRRNSGSRASFER